MWRDADRSRNKQQGRCTHNRQRVQRQTVALVLQEMNVAVDEFELRKTSKRNKHNMEGKHLHSWWRACVVGQIPRGNIPCCIYG